MTLCAECAESKGAEDQLEKIKTAPDKAAKRAAVDDFLKSVGR